jgi:hypothetical protein
MFFLISFLGVLPEFSYFENAKYHSSNDSNQRSNQRKSLKFRETLKFKQVEISTGKENRFCKIFNTFVVVVLVVVE